MATGYDLSAEEAAPILAERNIDRYTVLPLEGIPITYKGKQAWIMQSDVYIPFSETRPDGVHFVYVAGPDEQTPDPDDSIFNRIMKMAAWGLAVYAGVSLLNVFKKSN